MLSKCTLNALIHTSVLIFDNTFHGITSSVSPIFYITFILSQIYKEINEEIPFAYTVSDMFTHTYWYTYNISKRSTRILHRIVQYVNVRFMRIHKCRQLQPVFVSLSEEFV